MKIVILTGAFPKRSETFVVEHALGLARRGHEVSVVSYGSDPSVPREERKAIREAGVRIRQVPLPGSGAIARIRSMIELGLAGVDARERLRRRGDASRRSVAVGWRLRRAVEEQKPDVVHVHFGINARMLDLAGIEVPMVVTWHGFDANSVPRVSGEDMYHRLFANEALHTVGSRFMWGRLLELGAREARLRMVPMGVDLSKFSYHDRTGRARSRVKVVSVGRLDEMKGHRHLIGAVVSLLDAGIDIDLDIIGEGDERRLLEEQIEASGWRERIHLRGALPPGEVARLLEESDIFALACVEAKDGRVETQGVAIIEAQATGLPVVVGRAGGSPESLIDGASGYLVDPGSGELAVRLKLLAAEPERRLEFGRRGREVVMERFSLERMTDAFEALYLLPRSEGPAERSNADPSPGNAGEGSIRPKEPRGRIGVDSSVSEINREIA